MSYDVSKTALGIKKLFIYLPWAILVILILVLMNQGQKDKFQPIEPEPIYKTDTVYLERPYTPQKPLKQEVQPTKVKVYEHLGHDYWKEQFRKADSAIQHDSEWVQGLRKIYSDAFLINLPETGKAVDFSIVKKN